MDSSTISSLVMLVAIFAIMYLMVIRPQQKREKETQKMRDGLRVGDEIVTIGGFYGKIMRVSEDKIVIQCGADKTKLEIAKWAVSAVVSADQSKPAAKAKKEEDSDSKKPSPKSIKKLGAKDEAAAEEDKAE